MRTTKYWYAAYALYWAVFLSALSLLPGARRSLDAETVAQADCYKAGTNGELLIIPCGPTPTPIMPGAVDEFGTPVFPNNYGPLNLEEWLELKRLAGLFRVAKTPEQKKALWERHVAITIYGSKREVEKYPDHASLFPLPSLPDVPLSGFEAKEPREMGFFVDQERDMLRLNWNPGNGDPQASRTYYIIASSSSSQAHDPERLSDPFFHLEQYAWSEVDVPGPDGHFKAYSIISEGWRIVAYTRKDHLTDVSVSAADAPLAIPDDARLTSPPVEAVPAAIAAPQVTPLPTQVIEPDPLGVAISIERQMGHPAIAQQPGENPGQFMLRRMHPNGVFAGLLPADGDSRPAAEARRNFKPLLPRLFRQEREEANRLAVLFRSSADPVERKRRWVAYLDLMRFALRRDRGDDTIPFPYGEELLLESFATGWPKPEGYYVAEASGVLYLYWTDGSGDMAACFIFALGLTREGTPSNLEAQGLYAVAEKDQWHDELISGNLGRRIETEGLRITLDHLENIYVENLAAPASPWALGLSERPWLWWLALIPFLFAWVLRRRRVAAEQGVPDRSRRKAWAWALSLALALGLAGAGIRQYQLRQREQEKVRQAAELARLQRQQAEALRLQRAAMPSPSPTPFISPSNPLEPEYNPGHEVAEPRKNSPWVAEPSGTGAFTGISNTATWVQFPERSELETWVAEFEAQARAAPLGPVLLPLTDGEGRSSALGSLLSLLAAEQMNQDPWVAGRNHATLRNWSRWHLLVSGKADPLLAPPSAGKQPVAFGRLNKVKGGAWSLILKMRSRGKKMRQEKKLFHKGQLHRAPAWMASKLKVWQGKAGKAPLAPGDSLLASDQSLFLAEKALAQGPFGAYLWEQLRRSYPDSTLAISALIEDGRWANEFLALRLFPLGGPAPHMEELRFRALSYHSDHGLAWREGLKALAQDCSDLDLLNSVARSLFRLRQSSLAQRLYETAIRLSPNDSLLKLDAQRFYGDYAWDVRGHNFIKDTREDALIKMKELMTRRESLLSTASRDLPWIPEVYSANIGHHGTQGNMAEGLRWMAKGEALFPYNSSFSRHALNFLMPRWGGSLEVMLQLAAPRVERFPQLYTVLAYELEAFTAMSLGNLEPASVQTVGKLVGLYDRSPAWGRSLVFEEMLRTQPKNLWAWKSWFDDTMVMEALPVHFDMLERHGSGLPASGRLILWSEWLNYFSIWGKMDKPERIHMPDFKKPNLRKPSAAGSMQVNGSLKEQVEFKTWMADPANLEKVSLWISDAKRENALDYESLMRLANAFHRAEQVGLLKQVLEELGENRKGNILGPRDIVEMRQKVAEYITP